MKEPFLLFLAFSLVLVVFGVSETTNDHFTRAKRNAIPGDVYRWNASSIPYRLHANILNNIRTNIKLSLSYLEQNTCLRFTEVDENKISGPHIVYMDNPDECSSMVGRQFNKSHQYINLTMGCQQRFDQILHETLHAVGFYHEQSRSDRDAYVNVNSEIIHKINVPEGNWAKMNTDNQDLPYDYASIMQYSPSEGTSSRIRVITASNDLPTLIGEMGLPTFQDIKEINKLYKCSDSCLNNNSGLSCQNGGFIDPNNCERCKCPFGFGGTECTEFEATGKEDPAPAIKKCEGAVIQASSEWTALNGKFDIKGPASPLFVPDSCWWHIKAPVGKKVALKVQNMKKWGSDDCTDWDRNELNMEIKTADFWKTGYRFECYEPVLNQTFYSGDDLLVLGLYSNGYQNSFEASFKYVDASLPQGHNLQPKDFNDTW